MQEEGSISRQFLMVDDDTEFLSVVSALLKKMSKGQWAIRTATNHSQALEQLKAQAVDTVILDVEMPGVDGVAFLKLLGRTYPGQQVVMLSGRMDEAVRKTCLELGAALYLEKAM